MAKILFCEDDDYLNKMVSEFLMSFGHNVRSVRDGIEAVEAFNKEPFDLVLSDVMMPRLDGFGVAESIREQNKQVPLMFLTAKEDLASKQRGFNLGIDDYLTKPFSLDELILRINAILRRAGIMATNQISLNEFLMDKEEHVAYYKGESLGLTVREFDVLFRLLSYPKRTFTRAMLMDLFWEYDSSASSRTVDVFITKLRAKVSKCEEFEIVTVHGLGYKAVLK